MAIDTYAEDYLKYNFQKLDYPKPEIVRNLLAKDLQSLKTVAFWFHTWDKKYSMLHFEHNYTTIEMGT